MMDAARLSASAHPPLGGNSPDGVPCPVPSGEFYSQPAQHSRNAENPASASDLPRAGRVTIDLPFPPHLLSPNARLGRFARAALIKSYRRKVADLAWSAGVTALDTWQLVEVIFYPPNARWDQDNAIAAFKAGQDGLADAAGANDNDFRPVRTFGPPEPKGRVVAVMQEIPAD